MWFSDIAGFYISKMAILGLFRKRYSFKDTTQRAGKRKKRTIENRSFRIYSVSGHRWKKRRVNGSLGSSNTT